MNIQKAGCILIDIDNKKVGLIYRQKQNDFSFPKGHLEIGENLEECAIRETEEETGRKCCIISTKELPIVTYADSSGSLGDTHYFLACDEDQSTKAFNKELVHELVWKSPEDVENTLTYQNLKDFWREIKAIVDEVIKNENTYNQTAICKPDHQRA
ncbi:MAG TPA: hypothetical protein DCP90_08395 [Clostridiales bacterium]|nr:MAG: hypothetical protein A2Y22_07140 [Clostridiales bacterium GWD2_32_59]HAN10612.1 hypothetical protein [Clostridiales bacterium]